MPDISRRNSGDNAKEEDLSPLDPRRFTPSLHASLVSEILSLRRELEAKHRFIEDLENNLQATKGEIDSLNRQLGDGVREQKNTKRQLSQLETGTLAALEELARDRDGTKKINEDLKARVQALQEDMKTYEEDVHRTTSMWVKDKADWDAEKRAMERKIHVTESRMKTVLDELAAHHAAAQELSPRDSEDDDMRDSGLGNESDTNSIYSLNFGTYRNARHSRNKSSISLRRGLRNSQDISRTNDMTLADELNFDEEDEDDFYDLDNGDEDHPANEVRAKRSMESRHGQYPDDNQKAKRVLGISASSNTSPQKPVLELSRRKSLPSADNERFVNLLKHARSQTETAMQLAISQIPRELPQLVEGSGATVPTDKRKPECLSLRQTNYVNAGTQCSPPTSPQIGPVSAEPHIPVVLEEQVPSRGIKGASHVDGEPVCSRCKQDISTKPTKRSMSMVSASSQTIENIPSPPATPTTVPSSPVVPSILIRRSQYSSAVTQTELPERPQQIIEIDVPKRTLRAAPPVPIPIPSIEIHPPTSAPASPRDVVLPPRTKNAGAQTYFPEQHATRSVSMQTEEIRVDMRIQRLPPHLRPENICSALPTPEPTKTLRSVKTSLPKSAKALGKTPIGTTHGVDDDIPSSPPELALETATEDFYPGNNDNGPLSGQGQENPRRPHRTSSLFAGFDGGNNEDQELRELQGEVHGDDDVTSPTYPILDRQTRRLRSDRPFGKPPTPVPEEKETDSPDRLCEIRQQNERVSQPSSPQKRVVARNSSENARVNKTLRSGGVARSGSIRRTAMMQNGTAGHQRTRSGSPSHKSQTSVASSNRSSLGAPPFPVPSRSSSRRPMGMSKSEGSQSPTPRSGGLFSHRQALNRKASLRKIQSAAAIPRNGRGDVRHARSGSRSPTKSPTKPMPPTRAPPPIPKNIVASSQFVINAHCLDAKALVGPSADTNPQHPRQQTSVVDAIAATMVGEWMWKYVRRRKTFGGPENTNELEKSGDASSARHKRWVWLSPYERCVLWSSKQPTSGTALLGKGGRKCKCNSNIVTIT